MCYFNRLAFLKNLRKLIIFFNLAFSLNVLMSSAFELTFVVYTLRNHDLPVVYI